VDKLTCADEAGQTPRTLVVLDNCEHVLASAARVGADLLDVAPGLTILATSREPLAWVDEYLFTVPPLTQRHALALFRARAELAGRPLADSDQIAMGDSICRHVHNHPLFIRLAAARLGQQPLARILGELSGDSTDKRMHWSHGPRVGAEARHRGVGDVIAWSYELCTAKEQLLLDRLSVFAAGYDTNPADDTAGSVLDVGADLEAIEVVCSDDEKASDEEPAHDGQRRVGLAREEIADLLERLVDQSLIIAHITPTTVRYSLLESIRLFARQQLHSRSTSDTDEAVRMAGRHREYYRNKIAQEHGDWFCPVEYDLMEWGRAALDNILVAIETSLTTPGQAALGLELSMSLITLRGFMFLGSMWEMRQRTARALSATRSLDPQPVELQMTATALIGWAALIQGEHEDAEEMLEACIDICIDDPNTRRTWRHTVDASDLPA
ncbi:hypothetical protein ABZV91_32475, partial [Nocardia sp. NPDC004568]